jgi:hypothetical protein
MMDDAKLAAQALIDAQRILEEYLLPRPRTNERTILDRLVEVLDRPVLPWPSDDCSAASNLTQFLALSVSWCILRRFPRRGSLYWR